MDRGLLLSAFALLFSSLGFLAGAQGIGVNYGMLGDNLPSPANVITLYKSRNITKLRLFHPDAGALAALRNSGISLILGTYNQDLPRLASDPSFAASWVQTNVLPYANSVSFRCIAVGNEVIPGDLASYVLPAAHNLDSALRAAGFSIPVTTAVSTQVLNPSYPPSRGAFSGNSSPVMAPLVAFLAARNSPLLVNVYPYFAFAGNEADVRLDYALFTAGGKVVSDGELGYWNLFDAMVDAVYAAVERVGGGGEGVEVVVSETGWPSGGGGPAATVENARTYNNRLVDHVGRREGTPRRPGREMEVYLFAMFNENLKPEGTERNFGLFQPDMSEVYHVDFSAN
ncbi:hypothetical protein AXF42_Ash008600 [Apostasia shenzhenica]|uniref:Glucan endo-1,3-beta-glucosidase GVI n=1 Tax=Apostasia shenzhenica TaxID=1088818 RepID=A0A2I0B1U8_9ASPA|nr:hypothetical protein AXF42_Ash008600 [Apostasia shenzhenica]